VKPLLAAKTTKEDLEKLTFPQMISPKLDGIRCLNKDGQPMSRTLKPIPNLHIRKALSLAEFDGLDGELIVGPATDKDVFNKSTSGVMRSSGTPPFTYHVFDIFNMDAPFQKRYEALLKRSLPPFITVVPHYVVHTLDRLLEIEEEFVQQGYEGAMGRSLDGHYKQGRSTFREGILFKIKRFVDDEATILDMVEEMENLNEKTTNALGQSERSSHKENKRPKGTMGALVVKNTAGQQFEIGTGFTADNRADFWKRKQELIGQTVKYKHQEAGAKDKPRCPVFLGFRAD
jgi:DNA ligase-1